MPINKDWLFSSDEYICGVRTAGVLIRGGKIFIQRDKNGSEYALPGGHIKIGESLEDGLIREYKEEVGVTIKPRRLLWSEECFWEWNGRQAHGFAFYFLIDEDGDRIPDSGDFVEHKDNCNVVTGWLSFDELQKVTVYPQFLKEEIYRLDDPIKHFVSV